MMRHLTYNIYLIIASAILFAGCADDDFGSGKTTDLGDEIEFEIEYILPGTASIAGTRATGQGSDEAKLYNVGTYADVLVYEAEGTGGAMTETLVYHRGATVTPGADGKGTLKVTLAKSKAEEKYTIDVIFGAKTAVSNAFTNDLKLSSSGASYGKMVEIGMPRDSVVNRLGHTASGGTLTNSTSLSFWGGIRNPFKIANNVTIPGPIQVIRGFAIFDVGCNFDNNLEALGLPNFVPTSLSIHYSSYNNMLIPHPDKLNAAADQLTTPNVGWTYLPNNNSFTICSGLNQNTPGKLRSGWAYDLDGSHKDFPLFILQGNYTSPGGTVVSGYYALDLRDPNDPDKLLSIIRNHRYVINITEVSGPGAATAALARDYNNTMKNIKVSLSVYEEGKINYVAYNNSIYLGVSDLNIKLPSQETNYNSIYVKTNHYRGSGTNPTSNNGWISTITDENGAPIDWLTISPDNWHAGSAANIVPTQTVTLTATQNTSETPRTAYIRFSCHQQNLDMVVQVQQAGDWNIYSDYTGPQIRGDGDSYKVSAYGAVPQNLLVRAYSPDKNVQASFDVLVYNTTNVTTGEDSPEVQQLDIMGNASFPMAVRMVDFEYSQDNGTTWVRFDGGPQGKGHFRLRSSGRIVALYDYVDGDGNVSFSWAEAMGIDIRWDLVNGGIFYQTTYPIRDFYAEGYFNLRTVTNRNNLYYTPDQNFMTGCADYWEPGYEDKYPKGKWRLPALQELFEMHQYINHIGDLATIDEIYWSATDQYVTGGTYGGSFVVYLNPLNNPWFSSSDRGFTALVRCVYDDPDDKILIEKYGSWYFNPNKNPDE